MESSPTDWRPPHTQMHSRTVIYIFVNNKVFSDEHKTFVSDKRFWHTDHLEAESEHYGRYTSGSYSNVVRTIFPSSRGVGIWASIRKSWQYFLGTKNVATWVRKLVWRQFSTLKSKWHVLWNVYTLLHFWRWHNFGQRKISVMAEWSM